MKMMRKNSLNVKMVTALFPPFIGGAELQAELVAKTLTKRKVEVEVFSERPRKMKKRLTDDSLTVHRLWVPGYGKVRTFLLIGAFYRALRSCRSAVDIIHVHQAGWPAFSAVCAARKLGVPIIIKCSNSGSRFDLKMLSQTLPFGRNMAQHIARYTTRFVALNQQAAEQLAEWGVEENRIVYIPNGLLILNDSEAPEKRSRRTSLNLSQGSYVIVGVGSLTAKKDFTSLLKALARCKRDSFYALLLIGDGPLAPQLKAQAEALGIASHVRFVGCIPPSEVRGYLGAADLFVLPSVTEGMSNALLEAMAAGLPCVVSDTPGNRVLVDDKETGILFGVGDVNAIADAIEVVSHDRQLSEALGEKAKQKVMLGFDIELIADSYIELYESLLSNPDGFS